MTRLVKCSKILLVTTLVFGLCGCGAKANSDTVASGEVNAQGSQTEQEYPKIVFIENASYYGTDEKCEVVPRKAVDGVIETFVDAEIMPDVDGLANFGADQGKLEYMFVEDGRLIIHIGDDWYYFENQSENAAIENQWTESNEQGVLEATGYSIKAPGDAIEVNYSFCADEKMAQVNYQKDGINWTYRIKASSEAEDISGMNYEWNVSEEGTVSGKKAIYMGYSDAKEGSDFIDDVKYIQVVNWYDALTGVSYSLSASGTDLNGMDIQVYAEQIYDPLQKEVTDDAKKDSEEELKEYFLGEHIRSEDQSSVIINEAKDGKFDVDISIIRLCSLENGVGIFEDHVMKFTVKDPNDNELKGKIYRDSDNSLVVEITDSTWEYLPNGEKLEGFGK